MRLYRTPLLKRPPDIPPSGRRDKIRQRLMWFIPSITILAVWIILTLMEALPSVLGWVSYRLHDYVYLPIKGGFFNRPYPYSLVGWLLLLGITAAVVSSYLLDRSFILKPHQDLLRWIFNHPFLFGERMILSGTLWLQRLGFQSHLLRRALHHEWLLACDRLLRSHPGSRQAGRCLELARLTNWMVKIEASFPYTDYIMLLVNWHWAYVLIRAQASLSLIENNNSHLNNCGPATNKILETVRIVFRDFQNQDDSWLNQPPQEDKLFSIEELGRDLCRLLYPHILLAHPGDEQIPAPFEGSSKNLSEQRQKALLAQVVYCVDQRRFRLHTIALQFEQALQDPAKYSRLQSVELLPVTPHVWQLALSVALHAALDAKVYRLGTAFFEAQDATILTLSLGYGQFPAILERWVELISSFPNQEHYLAASNLRKLWLIPEEVAFNQLMGWDKDLIDSPDLTLSLLGLHALQTAGGPIEEIRRSRNEN